VRRALEVAAAAGMLLAVVAFVVLLALLGQLAP
jgi:hypothetical protein